MNRKSSYTTVSLTQEDANDYRDIIKLWADKHDNVEISLPKIIKLAMSELKKHLTGTA